MKRAVGQPLRGRRKEHLPNQIFPARPEGVPYLFAVRRAKAHQVL